MKEENYDSIVNKLIDQTIDVEKVYSTAYQIDRAAKKKTAEPNYSQNEQNLSSKFIYLIRFKYRARYRKKI